MPFLQLTQNPLECGFKETSDHGIELFDLFYNSLNESLLKNGHEKIWYQPDGSTKWKLRWLWMFCYKSEKRDFITRLNYASRSTFQIQFSHFGAKNPTPTEFIPSDIQPYLEYKGFPPHVLFKTRVDVELFTPLVAEHFIRIHQHLNNGGKLVARGWSHIEIALKSYLHKSDSDSWTGWDKPGFLGRKEIDLSLKDEKIAIEIQGDYWHRLDGAAERDAAKRDLLLENGWRLIWAWEGGIKEKFHRVTEALELIRSGHKFVEITKEEIKC